MRFQTLLLTLAFLLTAQVAQARSDRQILADWFRQRGHHLERLQVTADWALGTASWTGAGWCSSTSPRGAGRWWSPAGA